MRQRNDTTEALFVQRADPPFVVEPGATVDWPDHIIGMTVLPDEDSKPSKPANRAGKTPSTEEPAA